MVQRNFTRKHYEVRSSKVLIMDSINGFIGKILNVIKCGKKVVNHEVRS